MKCPFCSDFDNKVVDSRLSGDSDVIRRRRECLECGRRFTTYERVDDILPMVIKKDGRREPFDRSKILSGIQTACQKRPVPVPVMEEIVDRIEKEVQEKGDKEIKSSAIGETVMLELHDLDEVAYVRFASVYRSFKDINEFMDELKDMLEEETRRMKEEKTKR
ncbi:MAG: transcriptional regulator NrdR [bacterium]|nr:transcriptional regulator NrdR [bacterium]MDT8396201.1 transcriptional regulator NrdR [bacterium]